METTTITAKMHMEEAARKEFQKMLRKEQPKHAKSAEKKLNLKASIRLLSALREKLVEEYGDTVKEYLAAIDYIIYHLTHPDDRTIVNELLFYTGFLCSLMGICLGICGSAYVFLGKLPEAQTLAPYAGGFALAALLCFWGVRRK